MHVIVVGGGITGLAAAWELQEHGVPYTLLEGSERLGGKLVTFQEAGFTIEAGPDSFLTRKPWAFELAQKIGLVPRLQGTNLRERAVYVWRNGRLHPYPRGMRLIVPLDPEGLRSSTVLSREGIERMLAEEHVPPRQEASDESLAAFVRRRFGEEALGVFGDSLLAGIHAALPEELSIQATFPEYVDLERRFGSVIRGMREQARVIGDQNTAGVTSPFVAPIGGIQELTATLARQLSGTVRTGAQVRRVLGRAKVVLASGEEVEGSAVLLATPAKVAGELLAEAAPEASRILREFRVVSTATVSLGFSAAELGTELAGYGFIVPRCEDLRIMACTWSSTKLAHRAPPGHVLVRVFLGGAGREGDIEAHDEQLIAWAREDLRRTLGVCATPVVMRVHRWRQASPVYVVGHREMVRAVRAALPEWVVLAGAAYDGVGIPDCVRQGSEAARLLSEGSL